MSDDRPSVTVRDDPDADQYQAIAESGVVAGFAAYERHPDHVVFTHTVVDDAFEGRGVGSTLIRGALDAAREEGLRVVPQCPFVQTFIERHAEYADLV